MMKLIFSQLVMCSIEYVNQKNKSIYGNIQYANLRL